MQIERTHKLSFLRWESDVPFQNAIYTFSGWTKGSTKRQALRFIERHNKDNATEDTD